MCGVMKLNKIRNYIITETTKVWKESSGKKVVAVWARDEKRGTLRRKQGDGNEGTGGEIFFPKEFRPSHYLVW